MPTINRKAIYFQLACFCQHKRTWKRRAESILAHQAGIINIELAVFTPKKQRM